MRLFEFLHNSKKIICNYFNDYFTVNGTYTSLLPDKVYIKKVYKSRFGTKLNLKNPKTYNEKLQWIKLYDRNPLYTVLVDKYRVREYIKSKIGETYLIPLINTWNNVKEVDFGLLPNQFVLKCNHDNGVIICKDKTSLDIQRVKEELEYHFNRDYYKKLREWPYKNVPRVILAEKYIEDSNGELVDYKFFCFNGIVDCVMLCTNRKSGHANYIFYDLNWKRLLYQNDEPKLDNEIVKPKNFSEMVQIAKKLSVGFKQVRVDLYNVDGKVYFGELTFFNMSGFDTDISLETDLKWGNMINLDL